VVVVDEVADAPPADEGGSDGRDVVLGLIELKGAEGSG
jgi:hypothetical protein